MAWVLAQGLDAREALPLSTEFKLARLFEANTGYQPVQQDLHKKHIASIIRLYTVSLVVQTLYQKISRP